jgi:transcriptional regulator with XRE-family HTH domain
MASAANGDGGGNSGSWLSYFGEELRFAREAKGLSIRELAALTSYSYQQVGNVETGRRTPSEPFANEVDAGLGAGGRFARLLRRVLTEALPDWFQGAAAEEARAMRIRTYQCQVVHGLLQTEEYARALIRAAQPRASYERVEALVAARMARQSILAGEHPPYFWTILDESVLRRPVGGNAVMTQQLERLLKESANPNVTVQVLPFASGEHAAMSGDFTLWSYADRSDVLYVEGLSAVALNEGVTEVENARLTYDLLQAAALPREQSADMIRDVLEGYTP